MSAFTLGVHNVPAAEVVLIKTLLRLFPADLALQWRFAETGPYDAVLVDTTFLDGEIPHGLAPAVLKIRRAQAVTDHDCITRPIRAEQLQAWLASQANRLQAVRRPAVELLAASVATTSAGGPRFKLRRWPAAALLQNDLQRTRLATLLSCRALRVEDLSHISKQSPAQCLAFVDSLREAGLIEVERGDGGAVPAGRRDAAVGPRAGGTLAAGPKLPQAAARGLIGGIRRRLGL